MNQEPNSEAAETAQTTSVPAVDLPRLVSGCSTEDAVIEMIRKRGKVGRQKYRQSMDRKDLHPDEWIEHHQQELADALQYAERIKGASKLLHEARDIMLTLLHERDWECAADWVVRYNAQFLPANVAMDLPGDPSGPKTKNDVTAG
jgi:hypothetical protein